METINWLEVCKASLKDHYTSLALLYGMWGNPYLAKFYENLAKSIDTK